MHEAGRGRDRVLAERYAVAGRRDGASTSSPCPALSSVTLFDKPRPLPGQVFWHNFRMHFPKDAVLVKTISLTDVDGPRRPDSGSKRRLLHFDGEDWRGYTYAWRDDQTDADLVPADGAEKTFTVERPACRAAEKREQMWTFHSRTQCMSCHNAWSEYALAFNPRQLNGPGPGERDVPNQLDRLHATRVHPPRRRQRQASCRRYDEKSAAKEPALP